jgi:hypothetical protein
LTAADVERIAKRAAELVIELLKAELTKRDDRRTGG